MARRRLSFDEALLHGSAHHNKKRFADREDAPSYDGAVDPNPPEFFDELEAATYRELITLGLDLWRSDTIATQVTARLWAKWKRQHGNLTAADWRRLVAWSRKLGIKL